MEMDREVAISYTTPLDVALGGESPLEEEVVLTPSRRQLRRREAGWEGSPRRNPAPRNTNRVEGGAIWVSLHQMAKPVTINRVVT